MPKEHKKRGRREEKKRKRAQEEDQFSSKKLKSNQVSDAEIIIDSDQQHNGADHNSLTAPGEIPFYGLLDDEEQEYFKRADTLLELDQFKDADERKLFLANVYQEANGKELKLANSQSCSRLMERLILMSTPEQLKTLLQKFSGQYVIDITSRITAAADGCSFLNLAQHRFASHCSETLFLHAAPLVGDESTVTTERQSNTETQGSITMEDLFLSASEELEANLGYLMTDRFASHTLRVLLVVFSGRPLVDANTTTLLQSKSKEGIQLVSREHPRSSASSSARTVPDSFATALDRMIKGVLAGLDTTYLRALASHPVANPLLQLLLDLEFHRSGKSKAKDANSLFRKLLPDDPPTEGTDSASFFNSTLYDPIGSRLCESLVTSSPGKTFKVLYQSLFRNKLPTLARNETASYVLMKALERLSKEDLQEAVQELCPHVQLLVGRSRTSLIKCLVERCQVRGVESQPLAVALKEAYGERPVEMLSKMLQIQSAANGSMSDERRKEIENKDPTKAHASLLAQSMLEAAGPLRDLIMDGIIAMESDMLLRMASDRNATHVLQKSLACGGDTMRYRRIIMPRLIPMTLELSTDAVASHAVDAFWTGSEGLPFVRERIAEHLVQHEATLRDSIPGRAVWRNWKMDMYKTRRSDWMSEDKGRTPGVKSGIELARERYATQKQGPKVRGGRGKKSSSFPRGANTVVAASHG